MTNVTTLLRCARTVRHCTSAAVAAGLILISAGCHDAVTSPPITRLAPAQAPARSLESPSGGGATFSVTGEAPLAGSERDIGRYPTPTVVAMTVQQDFAVVLVQPGSSNAGRLGLAGRISAFGCTHQGEAYLVNFPDEGDFGFPFAGCQLAASPTLVTAFTDTVVVNGLVRYGYGFDAACPYPDSACASYSGSSGVSLSRLPATLGIFGDSVKDGTLRAWPRREYTLVAAPAPARLGRHPTPMQPTEGGWTFTPDSGSAQTDACDNGSGRVCTKTFQKSGFLTLVAIVNGARMTSPPIRVETPAVALALSADSVTVGDVVVATTTVIGLDTTALSYFYVSAPTAAAPAAEGLSPCVGTTPVPTRCYLVFTQPGRALVEVGASLDIRRGLSVNAQRFVVVSGNDRKVTLSVARRTIEPTARYWRFDTETKQYTQHPTRQPDTSRTVVTVSVADAAGKPIPNLDVVLSLEAREKSAGHDHVGRRPTGIFQTLAREPLPGGVVNTGLSGVAKVYFVASEVSGPVQLQGVSANAVRDTITVDVRIPDLVALGPGPHYVFTGAVEGRHTDNHYGTHAALAAFRQFADSVNGWIGEPLGINDISLQWGGLFDVGGEPWAIPHGYHRRGTHADIRTRYASRQVFSRKLQERMRALWRVTLHLGIPVNEADHLHLNFYP